MEIKWIQDPFDGSWIAQGESRRYRLYPQPNGWCAICHSWSAGWPRADSHPVNVQILATGVSLDEEAANLTEYQRAYQSAAQVFNIANSIMASALNLGVETAVT